MHLTNLKNRPSAATIPLPDALVIALQMCRGETPYRADHGLGFCVAFYVGQRPYWFDSVLIGQLRPAAKRAKITKHIGWHTFRRSLATLLMTNGEGGVKVVQELMRHANSKITFDVYAQGDEVAKRAAQEHVGAPAPSRKGELKIPPKYKALRQPEGFIFPSTRRRGYSLVPFQRHDPNALSLGSAL